MAISEYDRRIMKRVAFYPAKILMLVKNRGDVYCPERQRLAQAICGEPDDTLHITTLKLNAA
eukprot:11177771-Lingulodinium_polyedra.AAC.1